MNQQQFEQKLTPAQPKGWLWRLVASTVIKWLYDNADVILPILLERVFGVKKANRFLNAIAEDSGDCGPMPKYEVSHNGSWQCIGGEWKWIEDLG